MKKIFALTTTLLLLSCAIGSIPYQRTETTSKRSSSKEMNQLITAEIGKTLFSDEIGYYFDAIKITSGTKSIKKNMFGSTIYNDDIYIKKGESQGFDLYFPLKTFIKGSTLGVAISQTGGVEKVFVNWDAGSVIFEDTTSKIEYSKFQIDDEEKNTLSREFIFNGKNGNSLKFLYREYTNDLARSAFNQELVYDTTEGNIVGFKGLRIEVIKITNTQIEYKILSGFTED